MFFLMYVLCYYIDVFHISQTMLLHEIGGMNEYVCMYGAYANSSNESAHWFGCWRHRVSEKKCSAQESSHARENDL